MRDSLLPGEEVGPERPGEKENLPEEREYVGHPRVNLMHTALRGTESDQLAISPPRIAAAEPRFWPSWAWCNCLAHQPGEDNRTNQGPTGEPQQGSR